jgi:serine/threonine protein kinase
VTPQPDLVLGERYSLIRRIAVGGMGEVWEATDRLLGRAVAVKLLKDEYRTAPTFLARFRAEARHAGGLNHRGIATVYDYGESPDVAYLVMELVRGRPLSDLMAEQPDLPTVTKLSIMCQAAEGLQAAHDAGVIHRDVKPGNLLVRDDGTVKVTDFGIARALTSAPLTEHGQMIGTPAYISPEQASGGQVAAASDTYSLAVVAYELFAGHPPFVRDTPLAMALAHVDDPVPPLPESVPPNVAAIIHSALAKDPSQRPASSGEVARSLRQEMAALHASPPVLLSSPAGAGSMRPSGPTPTTVMHASDGDAQGAGPTRSVPVIAADERGPSPYPIALGFIAALLLVGVMIWPAVRPSSGGSARSEAPVPTAVSPTAHAGETAPATRSSTSPPAVTSPAVAAPSVAAPPATEPPATEPPATEPPATEPPATEPPSTAPPAVGGSAPVDDEEAFAFIIDYYERVAAGDYATAWASLSEEFRDARDLTFGRYVSYWENTTLEISDLRFVAGPSPDESRVVFEGRYTTGTRVVVETDEITLRRNADGSPIITAQRVV